MVSELETFGFIWSLVSVGGPSTQLDIISSLAQLLSSLTLHHGFCQDWQALIWRSVFANDPREA